MDGLEGRMNHQIVVRVRMMRSSSCLQQPSVPLSGVQSRECTVTGEIEVIVRLWVCER